MSGNECLVAGCNNPIIGQCPVEKGGCGRYYCRTHMLGDLCSVCGTKKLNAEKKKAEKAAREAEDQRRYQEYFQAAESVREPTTSKYLSPLLIVLGIAITYFSVVNGHEEFGACIGIPLVIVALVVGMSRTVKSQSAEKRLNALEKSKPGFHDFYYEVYKEIKNQAKKENPNDPRPNMAGELGKATGQGLWDMGKRFLHEITKDILKPP